MTNTVPMCNRQSFWPPRRVAINECKGASGVTHEGARDRVDILLFSWPSGKMTSNKRRREENRVIEAIDSSSVCESVSWCGRCYRWWNAAWLQIILVKVRAYGVLLWIFLVVGRQ
ncbi:hypothetical protein BDV37DRAFT_262581 [Aspergillus pseudonomiae]|uniref:Uncharacterized protein n=1 Tax=Aspergillus pseudonomiae TaxID=1506151 RepID=A0A5N7CWY3_9EURO|nr:uncharacterized protein BDV37DRAFT_262581 [Aspergillus pseudonomiae]KAE8398696.1 hypothetical protein BDV37DRAFT_262581 [Aspergillus pseudonomiae]